MENVFDLTQKLAQKAAFESSQRAYDLGRSAKLQRCTLAQASSVFVTQLGIDARLRELFHTGFQDLSGGAVGEAVGGGPDAQISLDTTAAGHGWYTDATPLDNTDDYRSTSNPNIWQAKAGTDAAGKMDMLGVLLHEYGHALGLEHSTDSSDYMAARSWICC